jgi:hypothetical protein
MGNEIMRSGKEVLNGNGKQGGNGKIGPLKKFFCKLNGTETIIVGGREILVSEKMKKAEGSILLAIGPESPKALPSTDIWKIILEAKPDATPELLGEIAGAMKEGLGKNGNTPAGILFVKSALPKILMADGNITSEQLGEVCRGACEYLKGVEIPFEKGARASMAQTAVAKAFEPLMANA